MKKRLIFSTVALIATHLRLIQELETLNTTTRSNNGHLKKREFTYFSLGGTSGGAIIKRYVERDERNRLVVSKNDIIN